MPEKRAAMAAAIPYRHARHCTIRRGKAQRQP
jgi:hypothetical protein